MSLEGQLLYRKWLRAVTGKTADWSELAKDCVAFANALGGRLLIGIEIPRRRLRAMLGRRVDDEVARMEGRQKGARYFLVA